MMYEVGMYGGSFNPLHMGHVSCIIQAANQCKELHIILSNGVNRNEIDVRVRYRWLYTITKHIGNVHIHILEDTADTKEGYTKEYWMKDAEEIKSVIGKKIDVVFCGDDYVNGDNFYKYCYPESELHYFKRDGISSTQIREDVYGHWEWLPNVVRPYYVKRVLLVGGESVGKSTMTINLANYYNTNYIEEAGRELSEKSGTDELMLLEDFTEILLTHKMNELKAVESSNKVLFVDTDCMITKFYLRFLENSEWQIRKNEVLADAIHALNHWDLILFLETDVEFVQDGTRTEEIRNNREKYSGMIKELFQNCDVPMISIRGDYQMRFQKITEIIEEMLEKR